MKAVTRLLAVVFVFILAASAQATIITTTWDATVYSAMNSGTAIGSTFTVTSTYDDAGTAMNHFSDGANGTADFGAPDETVVQTHRVSWWPRYASFDDAIVSISGINSTHGMPAFDWFSGHHMWTYVYDGGTPTLMDDKVTVQVVADDLVMWLTDYYDPDYADTVYLEWSFTRAKHYIDFERVVADAAVSYTGITSDAPADTALFSTGISSEVPAPATLALFCIGLAGLGTSRRRRAFDSQAIRSRTFPTHIVM